MTALNVSAAVPAGTAELPAAEVTDPPASQEAINRVLEYAWHRFNAFDERSGALKKRYRGIRESIILITWLTTLLAVLAISNYDKVLNLLLFGLPVILLGYIFLTAPYVERRGNSPLDWVGLILSNVLNRWRQLLAITAVFVGSIAGILALENAAPDLRAMFFRLALVILPLLSTGLLAFASRFESGNAWVGFRLVAEAIRRGIYVQRIKMGMQPLTRDDLEGMRKLVLDQRTRLEKMGIVTPLWGEEYQPGETLITPAYVDDPADDGYSPMTIHDYINWRAIHQANYYRRRIRTDYSKTRIFRGWILFIGALGAFLAAVEYGEFVAVTVALITALQAWLSLREHEQSYNIHMRTLLQMEDRIAAYHIGLKRLGDKAEKTEEDKQTILDFVNSVEDILGEERSFWQASVLQGQEATEASIAQLVSTTSTDWEPEPDLIEEGIPVEALPATAGADGDAAG